MYNNFWIIVVVGTNWNISKFLILDTLHTSLFSESTLCGCTKNHETLVNGFMILTILYDHPAKFYEIYKI